MAAKVAGFQYRPRTTEEMERRAHQSGTSKEGFIIPDVQTFTPADGDNKIRILPPTWEDAGHYGMDVWVHYGVGPENNAYICRQKMLTEACPVCEARAELDRAGDEDGARALLPKKRVAMFIIDRAQPGKGPLLWAAPWTLEADISKASIDDGVAYPLDSPDEGYDVSFTREVQGKNVPPKYVAPRISRKPSPIFDDEEETAAVLQWLMEHPIPAVLLYHDYDVIQGAFEGGPPANRFQEGGGKKEATEPPVSSGKPKAQGKLSFAKKPAPEPEPEPGPDPEQEMALPTWAEVHEMGDDDLFAFAEQAEVDFGETEFEDLAACADFVCEALGIEAPPPPPASKSKPSIGGGKSSIGGGKPSIGGGKPSVTGKPAKAAEADPPPAAAGSWKSKLSKFK